MKCFYSTDDGIPGASTHNHEHERCNLLPQAPALQPTTIAPKVIRKDESRWRKGSHYHLSN